MYFVSFTGHVPGVGAYSVRNYFGQIVRQGTLRECTRFVKRRKLA